MNIYVTFRDLLSGMSGQKVLINANSFEGKYAVGVLSILGGLAMFGYALARETKGVSQKVVYRMANDETDGVRFGTLAALMDSLSALTGKTVTFDDLLEFDPTDEPN